MPKINVIDSVYKTEKYLTKCLKNIISQALKNTEIICVNNGSLNNIINILNLYTLKDLKEKVIENANREFCICDISSRSNVWNKIYRRNELNQYNLEFVPNQYYENMTFTP